MPLHPNAAPDTPLSSTRVPRVALVLGKALVEERLLHKHETITVGQSLGNTFSVPLEGLPKSLPILSFSKGRYSLCVTKAMSGRLSQEDGVLTLGQLKESGHATRSGDTWTIPLSEQARGKVSLGPMTLLFQFVDPPPLSPRPRLPLSVRRTLVNRIEPKLAVILACSVLVHFAVALFAYTRDQIIQRPVERIAYSFQVGQYDLPEPLAEVETEDFAPTAEDSAPPAEVKPAASTQPIVSNSNTPKPLRARREIAPAKGLGPETLLDPEEAVRATAVVSVITGKNGQGLFSQMNNTDQGTSLDKSLDHIREHAMATKGPLVPTHRPVKRANKIGTGIDTEVEAPEEAEKVGHNKEEEPTVVTPRDLEGDSDFLDPREIIRRIRGKYLQGIKRCHQRALKVHPRLEGRVTIFLTVGPTGRVTKARVKGFSTEVDTCVQALVARWRFSAPKFDGDPTSADFEIPLILKSPAL